MKCVEYGSAQGSPVIYFHGAPGAMEEAAVFDQAAKQHNLRIISFDRFSLDQTLDRNAYYQAIADHIKRTIGTQPVDIIGFSIGAFVAFEVSARLKAQVRQTHLISAAAPIHAGDFIDKMAGGFVFKLAMKKPFLFTLLTHYQRLMAILAPKALTAMLFASAAGKDQTLIKQPDFKRYITPLLKQCFQRRANGYIRDIKHYVAWTGDLSSTTGKVCLWHGTLDNWSPFAMATYLDKEAPGEARLEAMEGLSHYSCLFEAAPRIGERLARD